MTLWGCTAERQDRPPPSSPGWKTEDRSLHRWALLPSQRLSDDFNVDWLKLYSHSAVPYPHLALQGVSAADGISTYCVSFYDCFRILTFTFIFPSLLFVSFPSFVFFFLSHPVLTFAQAIPSHGFHQFKSNSVDVLQRRIEELQVCPSVHCLSVLSRSSHHLSSTDLVFTYCRLSAWSNVSLIHTL